MGNWIQYAKSKENGCYSYEEVEEISDYLRRQSLLEPKVGIICGTGLGGLADILENTATLPYSKIPNFPMTTVAGHEGLIVLGTIHGTPVLCMKGRVHAYEGYNDAICAMPIRLMKLMGIKLVILTNAAGALNPEFNTGDIMLITDHINLPGLSGFNPLKGLNDDRWGERFPSMTNAYEPELTSLVKRCASELNLSNILREGVYCMVSGPSYETPAESRFLRNSGADSVGASTAHEATVARHCDMRVIGLSLITNSCGPHSGIVEDVNHESVMDESRKRIKEFQKLVSLIIENLKL